LLIGSTKALTKLSSSGKKSVEVKHISTHDLEKKSNQHLNIQARFMFHNSTLDSSLAEYSAIAEKYLSANCSVSQIVPFHCLTNSQNRTYFNNFCTQSILIKILCYNVPLTDSKQKHLTR